MIGHGSKRSNACSLVVLISRSAWSFSFSLRATGPGLQPSGHPAEPREEMNFKMKRLLGELALRKLLSVCSCQGSSPAVRRLVLCGQPEKKHPGFAGVAVPSVRGPAPRMTVPRSLANLKSRGTLSPPDRPAAFLWCVRPPAPPGKAPREQVPRPQLISNSPDFW